ncbi:hypothetical protein BDU57DRAFT_510765 [Ampelomyces quisqualis]|uniref:Uncharacterized protein n=1 Tax=Ampelomyces quisqualis TaxID=50730 RepID=A0A6A5R165_AMPQU|nr:hypothetical protein BDU57DRAFT_510765 [Ampelomyces quisqualis]
MAYVSLPVSPMDYSLAALMSSWEGVEDGLLGSACCCQSEGEIAGVKWFVAFSH